MFAGNEFDVAFQLQARGLSGVEVPVRLSWIDAEGKRTVAADRFLIPENSDEMTGMVVPLIAPQPGAYRLQVEAITQSGELVTGNNRQTAFVEIREGGGRILVLEGALRPEQTFLRRSLRRFPDLDLRYKWLRTDRTWPVDLDDWLQGGKFDVYILGDLDAAALGDDQLKQLAQTVAKGAGLITLGGFQPTAPVDMHHHPWPKSCRFGWIRHVAAMRKQQGQWLATRAIRRRFPARWQFNCESRTRSPTWAVMIPRRCGGSYRR